MEQVYKTEDLVLPILDLGPRAKIKLIVNDESVLLYIGPRDYQWDRKTSKWIGQGTAMPVKLRSRSKKKAA
jgi:hypothetical protein